MSVTRAFKWHGASASGPEGLPSGLDVCEAQRLLVKKLGAINISSRNVQNFRWRKQVLRASASLPGQPARPQRSLARRRRPPALRVTNG